MNLFANYTLGFVNGDSDGSGTFPAYSYDLGSEYGRASFDIRHNFVIGGNFNLGWGVAASPFIIASSGRPFNIIRGVDPNGDLLFTERPTFAELAQVCVQRNLTHKTYCDVAGEDPTAIIPRNYGDGPGFFSVNLRLSKNFGFGSSPQTAAAPQGGGQQAAGQAGGGDFSGGGRGGRGGGGGGGRGGAGGGGRGGGGGGRGAGGGGGGGGALFGGPEVRRPYNLNLGISFNNLFNTVNYGQPIGNITSGRFGQSTSTTGGFNFGGVGGGGGGGGSGSANRRIELQARFSW
jgi:hypothetical protein